MKTTLCKTCDNKDIRYVRNHGGHDYMPRLCCDYDMMPFPNAIKCDKYESRGHDDGEGVMEKSQ